VKTRGFIKNLHLWAGLIAGLILSVVGITGSLYVFEPEITGVLYRDLYKLDNAASLFENDIHIVRYVEETAQKKIQSIQWPKRGRDTYMFKFFDDVNWYLFDQSSGELTNNGTAFGHPVFSFVLDVHRHLLLDETGALITGTASLVFAFFMLTSGLYLWWPRTAARMRSAFIIKRGARARRRNFDLHNVSGFYFFLPLFLLGLTGAAFYFNAEIQWVLDKITISNAAQEYQMPDRTGPEFGGKELLDASQALHFMDQHYTNHQKRNLWVTDSPLRDISLAYQKETHVYAGSDTRVFLKADPITGAILHVSDPDKAPLGTRIMRKWHLQVHFGEFGGLLTRVLWFMAGFVPALLTYTGIKIWWPRSGFRRKP